MPNKLKLNREAKSGLIEFCDSTKMLVIEPFDTTGSYLGLCYENLSFNAKVIKDPVQYSASGSEIEEIISHSKDCLCINEIQAGWHVLKKTISEEYASYLMRDCLAGRFVLEHRGDYLQCLYSRRSMFLDFIDAREDCVMKFADLKLIDIRDYVPLN